MTKNSILLSVPNQVIVLKKRWKQITNLDQQGMGVRDRNSHHDRKPAGVSGTAHLVSRSYMNKVATDTYTMSQNKVDFRLASTISRAAEIAACHQASLHESCV